MELDRTKPFATIHPPHAGGHYEQAGLLFDVNGVVLPGQVTAAADAPAPEKRGPGRPRKEVPPAPPAAAPSVAPAMSKEKVLAQVEAQLQ